MNSPKRIGAAMYVIASVLVLVILTSLFSDAIDKQRNPNSDPTSISDPAGATSIVLQRNRAGHYVVNGILNGVNAEFLLDTGATAVSVSQAFAEHVGLRRGAALQAVTANGMTVAYQTVIESIAIGEIIERNVAASIVPNLPDGQILLGMSFLKRLDFSQRGDTLVLTQRNRAPSKPAN